MRCDGRWWQPSALFQALPLVVGHGRGRYFDVFVWFPCAFRSVYLKYSIQSCWDKFLSWDSISCIVNETTTRKTPRGRETVLDCWRVTDSIERTYMSSKHLQLGRLQNVQFGPPCKGLCYLVAFVFRYISPQFLLFPDGLKYECFIKLSVVCWYKIR